MALTIALAGNPNSGKTTLFNALTGSRQYVGNWPGVTVEKKEGRLLGFDDVRVQDLPGVYSLSPYTAEEGVTRDYLVAGRPDVILNIVDAGNLVRNLYLTTQLLELGIPVVIALNRMDVVRRRGDRIDAQALGRALGCPVVEMVAARGEGAAQAAEAAVGLAGKPCPARPAAIRMCERAGDCEAVIQARYAYIEGLVARVASKAEGGPPSASARIDRVLTHRVLALPIFALVMLSIYNIAVSTLGQAAAHFARDVFFGRWVSGGLEALLGRMGAADWLRGLIIDGMVAGVGAVLGFVPQMLVLFALLALLEECGYMARVAFIMDRLFRRFGLSGKSFIPLLIGMGCSVPGVMASRTIESVRERRMTVITTPFVPCGAKLPVVALMAGTLFGGAAWVAAGAYFMGVGAVAASGIILKKTRPFAGAAAPFILELPDYHRPRAGAVLHRTWERGRAFIQRAGTVILLASVLVWFLSGFGFTAGRFGMVADMDDSILATLGGMIAALFKPLGFGFWQAGVATLMGFAAKEEIVGVFGVLFGAAAQPSLAAAFTGPGGLAFLAFNLLCMPCAAAVGAIGREMNSLRWTLFAVSYQTAFAYGVALVIYQLGMFLSGRGFGPGTAAALTVLGAYIYLLARPPSHSRQTIPGREAAPPCVWRSGCQRCGRARQKARSAGGPG